MLACSYSIKGHRDKNEDNHDVILNINKKDTCKKDINYIAVYDGHGGAEVSTYLKSNLSKKFTDTKLTYPLDKNIIKKIYDDIQQDLKKYKYSKNTGSTCCVTIQFNKSDNMFLSVINIGDSRCVLCRDNFAVPLTKDHKPNWPEETDRIKKLNGEITYDGYDWRVKALSVSRSFGDVSAAPFVTHKPDVFLYKIDKKDKFYVLACDGLWDVISNSDVINFVLRECYDDYFTNKTKKDCDQIAKKLCEYAFKKGSTDNITVVVVFL